MTNFPGAVLWDMDGTIVNSEEFHWTSWRDTMAAEGISITHAQFLATFGLRNDSILPLWLGPHLTAERAERVANAKEACYRELVRQHGIAPLPGVIGWLEKLHAAGWRQAVASSAPRLNVVTVLEAIDAAPFFQCIVSAEDVTKGKPDPEVYLTAAAHLKAPPNRCIVVEDALAGIQGAQRAGMRSIGICAPDQPYPADIVTDSLERLAPDCFDALLKRHERREP